MYALPFLKLGKLFLHAVYSRLFSGYPALDIRERFSVAPLLAVAHILKLPRHPFLFGYGAGHGVGFALGYIELRYQVLVFFLGVLQNVGVYRLHHGVDTVKVLFVYLPVGFGKALDLFPCIGEIPLKVFLGILGHYAVRPLPLPFAVPLRRHVLIAFGLDAVLAHDLLIGFHGGGEGLAVMPACLVEGLFEYVVQGIAQFLISARNGVKYSGSLLGIKPLFTAADKILDDGYIILAGQILNAFVLDRL